MSNLKPNTSDFKIQIDLLKLAVCDFDWLKDQLQENPKALAHRKESDAILLTASSADLQRFVLEHLADSVGAGPLCDATPWRIGVRS